MLKRFEFGLPGAKAAGRAYYFGYHDNHILWSGSDRSPVPLTGEEWQGGGFGDLPRYYFGSYRGLPCYAVACESRVEAPPGSEWIALRQVLIDGDDELFLIAGRGRQILEFHRTHRYCGLCGRPNREHDKEIALYCPECKHTCYPRVSPCIIVLVTRGEELLLARSARFPTAMYSTLAGFIEAGETIEQAVHREVLEEAGVRIRDLRYYASQAWPFPHQLMIGFHALHDSGDITLDDEEIVDAQWWHYTALPQTPPRSAMSGMLIASFIERVKRGG